MLDKTLADPATLSDRYAGSLAYDALSDKELLEWFVRRHEEAAFAALVRRHGPMVLGVCRRVLRHSHDAEDAFQATFLILVEKAHRLKRPELLANWLYGVAYRTALHARQRGARRSEREREAAAMSVPKSDPEYEPTELRRVLDEELHRLPEKYRAPLILCYLEGKTNEEAAQVLGWPSGSMSHRLARGRELLRERLQSRLAGLTILLPTIVLADYFRPDVVPPLLAATTVNAAVIVAGAKMATAGSALISASVRELMEATLRIRAPSRWHWLFVALLLLLSLFGLGAAVYVVAGGGTNSGACSGPSSP
ncbi:MAG TPA: sigma-70 family RNA polymerase sigma factor [Gemmataceae bacterium]|nr:sigma-70 family RNA polymerase sigma factor [Gemmataceae bacterium]